LFIIDERLYILATQSADDSADEPAGGFRQPHCPFRRGIRDGEQPESTAEQGAGRLRAVEESLRQGSSCPHRGV